ncbi:hypothetical protein [Haloarcula marina]|uniref:hypothetical protein n=1 Tax=Haloarcula marina TaxID=2961574 RepID=UPI0020B6D636|nr:hypothetical protein [Halomicroarcula marina]
MPMTAKGLLETVGDHVREHRSGMLVDLVFAFAWVTVVTVVFDLFAGAPEWLYYLTMLGGVVAYFGFFASLEAVREGDGDE